MLQQYAKLDCGFSELDEYLLGYYPELDRAIMFLNQLKRLDPKKRGSLVYRIMDVLELTKRRFLERVHEDGRDEY